MKNKSIGDDYKLKNPHVNLFYRAMRITTFLLFFCSFCALADNVNSQTAKVTIKRSNVTLLDVLNEIENQTNYLFIYSNDINVKRPVSINVNAKAVNSVLAKLFAGKDVAYQMEGTHIVLTKTEKSLNEVSVQQQSKRMENITGVVLDEAGVVSSTVRSHIFLRHSLLQVQNNHAFEYVRQFRPTHTSARFGLSCCQLPV